MTFLAPLNLLWLVPFVGGLLLLYFLRSRREVRVVSSLYLWSVLAQNSRADRPFEKLKISLLLILQLLALAGIILALAHPFSKMSTGPGAEYVIIIENSASMSATDVVPNRMTQARNQAVQFVQQVLTGRDRAAIITAGSSARILCPFTSKKSDLIEAITTITVDDTEPDIAGALQLERSVAGTGRVQIVLVGDGVWSDIADETARTVVTASHVRFDRIGSLSPSNIGISGMAERTDPSHPDLPAQLLLSVGRRDAGGAVSITVDGKAVAADTIAHGDGAMTRVYPLNGLVDGSMVTAAIRPLKTDDLSSDNIGRLVVHHVGARRILLVTSGDPYLERALALLPDARLYELSPDSYYFNPDQFDIVVFDKWVPADLPSCPALILGAVNDEVPVVVAADEKPSSKIVDWDDSDPLLGFVDLSNIHIHSSIQAHPLDWGRVVADMETGPAIVEGTRSGQKIVWVAFSPRDSDLPLTVAFPIFLSNAVEELSPRTTTAFATNSPMSLPPVSGNWIVTKPNGIVDTVPCASANGCVDTDTNEVGTYKARAPGRAITFEMNLISPTETSLTPSDELPSAVTQSRTGTNSLGYRADLVPLIAILVLALILTEWLVYLRPLRYTKPT